MDLPINIPDELAQRYGFNHEAVGRRVLEALVAENVRTGLLTAVDIREALGFETADQVDAFFKAHGIHDERSMAETSAAKADPA